MKTIKLISLLLVSYVGIYFFINSAPHTLPISLQSWLQSGLNTLQRFTGVELPELFSNPEIEPQIDSFPDAVRIDDHLTSSYCKPGSRGEIKRTGGQQFYRWVDSQGETHFSDQQPDPSSSNFESIATQGQLKYFELLLHADKQGLSPLFRTELTIRINKAYDVLSTLIEKSLLQKVKVNLWVFNQRSAYEEFQHHYAPKLSGSSSGFHSPRHNIAAAHRISDVQLLSTSVHEAVHVMNTGMFGRLPRWLNEGLAEYLEEMKVYGQAVEIAPRVRLLRTLGGSPLPIVTVIESDFEDWMGTHRNSLYAHSWGLVYFLMAHDEGQSLLQKILTTSASAPCREENTIQFIERHYNGGVAALQVAFTNWLKRPKISQQF